jgi:CTP synthase
MNKFIFVTGGVVSGLGKGITAASIGLILKSNGISVDAIKFDPYLNVDPGTMSPFEHGEVFVLNDGTECDLDLGHYERFLDTDLSSNSSVTAGKIYSSILEMERHGDFLGKNVQLIPNVTNYIKDCFKKDKKVDVRIIEIGGSSGDMEGNIFLEAIRQFKQEYNEDILHVHLGYIPFLACSGEYKTKPFQSSIRELLRSGLQPNVLIARYEPNPNSILEIEQVAKIALFGNVKEKNVIPVPDLESIYAVPKYLTQNGIIPILNNFVDQKLQSQLPEFFEQSGKISNPLKTLKVALVGKYGSRLGDADYSVVQSLRIAGFFAKVELELLIVSAEDLLDTKSDSYKNLIESDCVLVLGGFGQRGMEGKIIASNIARTTKKPFLGICLGLQMAVIEFARHVCSLNAFSAEMTDVEDDLYDHVMIIDFMESQKKLLLNNGKKGGTMRLGSYSCKILEGTLASQLFGTDTINERHRHRLEVQTNFVPILEEHGMKVSGKYYYTETDYLPEIIELDKDLHPYYIAIQSHPEMLSRPSKPHPLFLGLLEAGKKAKIA